MTSTHPESLHPGAGILPRSGTLRRKVRYGGALRLAVGTVAVLILIALGFQDSRLTNSSPSAESDPAPAAAPAATPAATPAYDGRGKWRGY